MNKFAKFSLPENSALRTLYLIYGEKEDANENPFTFSEIKDLALNWKENVCMILSNRTRGDTKTLIKIGEALCAQGKVTQGHLWYI